ncbi:ATP-binding cassette domain-containing protein [Haliangium sp.]|uniref:ABC transporter ATP-binding protein n=1 Tax=Haliangium sp. TaxID=2663208 RepID=UPI003D0DE015
MLEVHKLSKSFRVPKQRGKRAKVGLDETERRHQGAHFFAVKDVSFSAQPGTILGLLGPNGAGKTTLLRMLSTAITPTAGTASMDGVDIVRAPLAVRKKIGFLSGSTGLYGRLTAREMVAYYGALHGLDRRTLRQRMDELFGLLAVDAYADRRNDQLSTGMKQKVSIARTLIHDPEIVILDEPTTGLDVVAAETVTDIVRRCKAQGKTVLFSTHHMHEVDLLCDHVVVIDEGRLCFEGSVPDMRERTNEEKLDRAFLALIGRGGEA